MNFNFPGGAEDERNREYFSRAENFIQDNLELIIAGVILLAAIIIILAVLQIIGRGALIKSLFALAADREADFKTGWRAGKKYFWKLLFVGLLIALFVLVFFAALATPVIFLVIVKSYAWAVFLGLVAFLIFAAIAFLSGFIREYSYLYLVSSDLKIRPAVENAFEILRRNFWPSIIFALIMMAAGIIFGVLIFLLMVAAGIIFLAPVLILFSTGAKIAALILSAAGVLVFSAAVLFLQSVFLVFRQAGWVLFFMEIASEEKEEAVRETVKVPEKALEGGEA